MARTNNFKEYQEHLRSILESDLLPERAFQSQEMKIIHDPLWGSRLFYPWEVALIDSPLCQRLRRIHQLGTAFLTYPSAVHSRFSHTLGVTILAGRLINRLKEKSEILNLKIKISPRDIYTVRLAGILHDVGHSFFSHASEKTLKPILAKILRELRIENPKPHEFISYMIVTNPYFIKFWNKHIKPLFPDKKHVPDTQDIANIIIKKSPSPEKTYLRDIISGPYDVDKLEYLYRDARTAGLEISYDIERYFYKINIFNKKPNTWRLAMDLGGVSAIEQIIFSKMMLYSFVYHHQKVLASDALIYDLLYELLNNKSKGSVKIKHPLDFLRYTDYDLLSNNNDSPSKRFREIKKKLVFRELPERCFVMNTEFVEDIADSDTKNNWDKLKKDLRDYEKQFSIRKEIVSMYNKKYRLKINVDDIHIVFPEIPEVEEPKQAPIVNSNGQLEAMGGYFFDLEGWQKTYDLKKLRGYFYSSINIKKNAANIIEEFIYKKYNIKFKYNARKEAKLPDTKLSARI